MSEISKQPSSAIHTVDNKDSTQINMVGGFSILVILIVMIAWISLYQMNRNQQQLKHVLDVHVVKLELINDMRRAARERTVAMQKLFLLDDPFEQDNVFLAFNQYGTEFAGSRNQYVEMSLDDQEKNILNRQGDLTNQNVPYQRMVIELVMDGKKQQAHDLLTDVAIPGQERVLQQLDFLYDLQKKAAEAAVLQQSEGYHQARSLILFIVIVIISIAILVALFVFLSTRQYQRALFESRQKAVVTLRSIGEAVVSIDSNGNIEYLNAQAEKLLSIHLDTVRGKSVEHYVTLYRGETLVAFDQLTHDSEATSDDNLEIHELNLRTRNKEYIIELTMSPIHDEGGELSGNVMVLRDVTTIRALDEEVKYQAAHDSLTGLFNRHEFERRIQRLLEQARQDQSEHAVCYVDLDMFKVVNDTCGHIAGDELLRQLSMLLQASIRKSDSLARVGGDEFALLLQNCPLDQATAIAEKFLSVIESFRFHWKNNSFQIGASIGVAPIRSDSGTLVDIIQTADFACYSAKDEGRNRVHTADLDMDMVETRRGHAHWMAQMQDALQHDRFELYCQEIQSLQQPTDNTRRVELLLRMKDEKGELVSPMAFIPAAERYHIMPQIDRWVIRKATTLLAQATSRRSSQQWFISINLSGQSFSDRTFLDYVLEQLDISGVRPENICFEVTETSAIRNLSDAIRFMNTLRGIGCQFSLDDFGSGLSSFAYLRNLPVDSVKIDGIFIRDLKNDFTHRAIVSSITHIAHTMKIKTIAEYIETEDIRKVAVELGVDFGQGYFFGKPVPFMPYLDNQNEANL